MSTLRWEMALSNQITNSRNPFSVRVPQLCVGSPKCGRNLWAVISQKCICDVFHGKKEGLSGTGTCSKAVRSSPGRTESRQEPMLLMLEKGKGGSDMDLQEQAQRRATKRI